MAKSLLWPVLTFFLGPCSVSAADTGRVARDFLEVSISPDASRIADVEGDTSPHGGDPAVRELLIRTVDGARSVNVRLPCGGIKGCWPQSLAWTPDGRRLTFAVRDPATHARSIYQVAADGG